eukprot:GHVO01023974.1.p1 GENE.GHVO01023974.1~~GHVO01023974.1.p1  ORF type:complete len:165 (-),score=16.30 GHVO01023974.1:198-662(-)
MPHHRNAEKTPCPHCTLKMHCPRHKHGRSEKGPKDMKASLDKLYDELVSSRLSRYEPSSSALSLKGAATDEKWKEALAAAKADRRGGAPKSLPVKSESRRAKRQMSFSSSSSDSSSSEDSRERRKRRKEKKKAKREERKRTDSIESKTQISKKL